jgi:hypothetical protein
MVSPLVLPLVSLEGLLWEIVFGVVLMPHGCRTSSDYFQNLELLLTEVNAYRVVLLRIEMGLMYAVMLKRRKYCPFLL